MKIMMASAIGLCLAVLTVPGARSAQNARLRATQLDITTASGKVLATLGPTADGNVLTFFDSKGKKTLTLGNNANQSFAGIATWDNNNVVAGSGIVRTLFGEANAGAGPNAGLGGAVLDANGKERTAFGMSADLTVNDFVAIDASGTSTGIGIFPTSFAGYFTNDLNGINRQYSFLSLDGNTNVWAENDATGALRVAATQAHDDTPNSQGHFGNGFSLWDANGQQRVGMAAATDGSYAQFALLDTNNVFRVSALLTTTSAVDTFDGTGAVTGHLP